MLFNECFKPSVETAQGKTNCCFFFKTLLLIDKAHPSAPMEMYKETKMCSYAATIPVLLCVP